MSMIWITKADGNHSVEETEFMVRTVFPLIDADNSVLQTLQNYDQSTMFPTLRSMSYEQKELVRKIWIGTVRADDMTYISELEMFERLCRESDIESRSPFSQEEIMKTILKDPYTR